MKMPIRRATPARALALLCILSFFIFLFKLSSILQRTKDFDLDFLLLEGPSFLQDDPRLLSWTNEHIVPPSEKPYNLSLLMSGLPQESAQSPYSPSQEFILERVTDLFESQKLPRRKTFFEAGAYDGEFLSNTLYFEHELKWRGILVEANPFFFNRLLQKNRKSYAINVCLATRPYPTKEEFIEMDPNYIENHAANSRVINNTIERHYNLASSRLVKHSDKNDEVMAIECYKFEELKEYLKSKGYSHVESQREDHIFVNSKFKRNKKPGHRQ